MRIAVSGSTGLVGSAVVPALAMAGHSVVRLVRPGSAARGVSWDPAAGTIDLEGLNGIDAVIHLAGESLVGVWTAEKKRRILASREQGTKLLATSLGKLQHTPSVLVSASAIGYYGDHAGDEPVDEGAPRGSGYLADVVEAWEGATGPARKAGVRVVNTRFGLVLSGQGGALAPMLPIFRAGLGGKLGSGRQFWSWVAIDDVVAAILFSLTTQHLGGPVNVVAPLAVTNAAFTRTLGRVLRRPTIFGVPELLLKLVGGQMTREMVLAGARVVPRKLQMAGYDFMYPELEAALQHILERA